jgi:urease accessory protein
MVLPAPFAAPHQRASGRLSASFRAGPGGARLALLEQHAPLRLLCPEAEPGEPSCGVIVNVGGGLAGGDRLALAFALGRSATACLTSASAERVYRSLGPPAEVEVELRATAGAVLEWLPQETILYDRARLRRRLSLRLARDAGALLVDMLVLGRAAHGEAWCSGSLDDSWSVEREGRLLWHDRLLIEDPAAARADPFRLDGAAAIATLLLAGPRAEACRALLRETTPTATLVAPGLLLARCAGSAEAVRDGLSQAIRRLRDAAFGHPPTLPRSFRC